MATALTILGECYVDDRGSDGEPAALLWPSLFTGRGMWRYQVPALRAAGWRTPALDPPGRGMVLTNTTAEAATPFERKVKLVDTERLALWG